MFYIQDTEDNNQPVIHRSLYRNHLEAIKHARIINSIYDKKRVKVKVFYIRQHQLMFNWTDWSWKI